MSEERPKLAQRLNVTDKEVIRFTRVVEKRNAGILANFRNDSLNDRYDGVVARLRQYLVRLNDLASEKYQLVNETTHLCAALHEASLARDIRHCAVCDCFATFIDSSSSSERPFPTACSSTAWLQQWWPPLPTTTQCHCPCTRR